jgi:hypothetical protein
MQLFLLIIRYFIAHDYAMFEILISDTTQQNTGENNIKQYIN